MTLHNFTVEALRNLMPDGGWSVTGTEVSFHADKQVSKSEIQFKINELQAEHEANEYQRQRAVEYPSWQDQLDKIYHEGLDVWKAEIKAIKDKYPKPDQA